jgi:hypothetical protein
MRRLAERLSRPRSSPSTWESSARSPTSALTTYARSASPDDSLAERAVVVEGRV